MSSTSGIAFPADRIAFFGLACAVTGAAALLTQYNAGDLRLWWRARNWIKAECTLLRVESEVRYRYQAGGRTYESGAVEIGSRFSNFFEAVGGKGPGDTLPCWINPAEPGEALLHRDYAGWWWLPGAWLLAVFLLATTAAPLCRALWAWLTYRPDPPLSWAQWLATFYRGHAWMFTLAGTACLAAGLIAVRFLSIEPWWNWWQAQSWTPTPCTVTRCELRSWGAGSGLHATGGYLLDIAFAYEHAGRTYTGSQFSPWRLGKTDWTLQASRPTGPGSIADWMERLPAGSRHTCYVSPRNPRRAYLSREMSTFGAYLAAFGPFLSLVGLMIIWARPR